MTGTVGDTVTISLSEHFTDPDGDVLTIAGASSDVTVVSVGVSDGGDAGEIAKGAVFDFSDMGGSGRGGGRGGGGTGAGPWDLSDYRESAEYQLTLRGLKNFMEPLVTDIMQETRSDMPEAYRVAENLLLQNNLMLPAHAQGLREFFVGGDFESSYFDKYSAQDYMTDERRSRIGEIMDAYRSRFPQVLSEYNRAPTSVGSITGRTLFPGETATVDLDLYFRDPDRDGLTYGASSSDVAVVAVSVSGSVLTAVGVSRGEALIAITARDPGELVARASMSVAVKDLTGRWRGAARLTCRRPGKRESLACYRPPWIFMEFDISLAEMAGSLSGRAIVSWSSSDQDSGRYTPAITIGRRGNFRRMEFVMRYEGDLLEYEGVLSADEAEMRGTMTWMAEWSNEEPFVLVREGG